MTRTQDSRDLLAMLTCADGGGTTYPPKPKENNNGSVENVELSLGLSLNGKFGSEPQTTSVTKDNNINKVWVNYDVELSLNSGFLTRTCSLPMETDVELRKRKELQSLRRLEAKRKRVEKMTKNNVGVGLKRSTPLLRFSSQGSIGSQESGGSSGVTDLENQPFSGATKETSGTNDGSELNEVKCNPNQKIKADKDCAYNETMPCVTTKEEGPDGRRIQGFLYRYGKGEEVRIVCVCHGSFLTPAEFVKHGGGGDVDHPLRHIIVTSLFR